MAASTTASNLAGVWFGELASALQGTWQQAVAPTHHQPQQKLGLGGQGHQQSQKKAAQQDQVAAVAGRKQKAAVDEDVGRCCGAMSDTTVYLLLDRFAPS